MNELDQILSTWRALQGTSRDAVLATVVHVTGSAYRRPGARMLLVPDGRRVGSISGGCLEGEIAKKAWWYTESLKPELRVYDTTSDDDAVWEFGLGCNGVVHVLLERTEAPETSQMLAFADRQRALGADCVIATIVGSGSASGIAVGERMLTQADGTHSGGMSNLAIAQRTATHIQAAFVLKRSALVSFDQCEVFVEYVGRPLSVVIFGAGHDAIPLVEAAANMGWDVTVADGRPAYAKPERFPRAKRVVVMSSPDLLQGIELAPETAVVMMTHNFPMDRRLMPLILDRAPQYVGLLGPKSRAAKLFRELGVEQPAYVHAPAGLDLGGDAPTAIALSITSEIQAVVSNRTGGLLQLRREPIHDPAVSIGEQRCIPIQADRPEYCEIEAETNAYA